MENLSARLRQWIVPRLEGTGRGALLQTWTHLAAFASLALLVSGYSLLPQLEVYGHDEVHYYADLSFKLGEDGRWLNHLLHGFLRILPPATWAVLLLIAAWTLFFRLGRSLRLDGACAALLASSLLLAPPFMEQSIWPATTIVAIVVLLLAQAWIGRGAPEGRVYLFAGILSFGTVQSFYFLMPLFFLGRFLHGQEAGARGWWVFLRHMSWWVAGAIAGVLVMSTLLWFYTDHFGVRPAEWRRTQPVQDFDGLVRNVLYAAGMFREQSAQLAQQSGAGRIFLLLLAGLMLARRKTLRTLLFPFLILVAVAASFFAFSVPLAPVIQSRSLVALAAAFVVVPAMLYARSVAGQLLVVALLLKLALSFSYVDHLYLARHRAETGFLYHKLEQALPAPAGSYSAVFLVGSMAPGSTGAPLFNDASRMHGIMHALGVRDHFDCRHGMDEGCAAAAAIPTQATMLFGDGLMDIAVSGDRAVLRYRDAAAP